MPELDIVGTTLRPSAKEQRMFMNKKIAADVGKAVERAAVRQGASLVEARKIGREVEARKLKSLDDWTRNNVGLD